MKTAILFSFSTVVIIGLYCELNFVSCASLVNPKPKPAMQLLQQGVDKVEAAKLPRVGREASNLKARFPRSLIAESKYQGIAESASQIMPESNDTAKAVIEIPTTKEPKETTEETTEETIEETTEQTTEQTTEETTKETETTEETTKETETTEETTKETETTEEINETTKEITTKAPEATTASKTTKRPRRKTTKKPRPATIKTTEKPLKPSTVPPNNTAIQVLSHSNFTKPAPHSQALVANTKPNTFINDVFQSLPITLNETENVQTENESAFQKTMPSNPKKAAEWILAHTFGSFWLEDGA